MNPPNGQSVNQSIKSPLLYTIYIEEKLEVPDETAPHKKQALECDATRHKPQVTRHPARHSDLTLWLDLN
jgi:hypothetical protein